MRRYWSRDFGRIILLRTLLACRRRFTAAFTLPRQRAARQAQMVLETVILLESRNVSRSKKQIASVHPQPLLLGIIRDFGIRWLATQLVERSLQVDEDEVVKSERLEDVIAAQRQLVAAGAANAQVDREVGR